MEIDTILDLKTQIESGPYAWPGGYPLFFISEDGEALSFEAVKGEIETIDESWTDNSGWKIIAVGINWEDENLFCGHTGKQIECAYPSDKCYSYSFRWTSDRIKEIHGYKKYITTDGGPYKTNEFMQERIKGIIESLQDREGESLTIAGYREIEKERGPNTKTIEDVIS